MHNPKAERVAAGRLAALVFCTRTKLIFILEYACFFECKRVKPFRLLSVLKICLDRGQIFYIKP